MTMREIERVLKALANERRLAIVRLLSLHKEMMVSEITDRIHLSFRATSRHLRVLENAGVLTSDRSGLRVYYRRGTAHTKLLTCIFSTLEHHKTSK